MDDVDVIARYLGELEAALRRAGRPTQPLVDEASAHLFEDAARIARVEACGDAQAARRAVERFGRVADVVAASRQHARVAAANVARVATIVMLAAMAFVTLAQPYDYEMGWPLVGGSIATMAWLPLFAELLLVSVGLWRALRGGRVSRLLVTALQLNGAVAFVLAASYVGLGVPMHLRARMRIDFLTFMNVVPPLWVLMCVQSVAALRALRRQSVESPRTASQSIAPR